MNEKQVPRKGGEQPAPPPLDVSVKITPSQKEGNLLAFANVTLGGCFAVRGIRVMNGKNGLFVGMPDRQNSKGENIEVCFPVTAEMRTALNTAVLTEYQHTMEQFADRGSKAKASVRDALQGAKKAAANRSTPAQDKDKTPRQRSAGKGAR